MSLEGAAAGAASVRALPMGVHALPPAPAAWTLHRVAPRAQPVYTRSGAPVRATDCGSDHARIVPDGAEATLRAMSRAPRPQVRKEREHRLGDLQQCHLGHTDGEPRQTTRVRAVL